MIQRKNSDALMLHVCNLTHNISVLDFFFPLSHVLSPQLYTN